MNIEKKAGGVAGLILTLTCLGASTASAQIPDELKNLKVLPQDISQKDLVNQMRGFATGLGVRCHHCHVGEPGASLEGYDFASIGGGIMAAGVVYLIVAGIVWALPNGSQQIRALFPPVVTGPVITVIGLQMGWLLGGAVISEVVFAYPGMGRLAVTAISYRDVPVIQSFVAITALIVVVINLGVDIVYSWLDPRIRLNE